ncbi:MAG: phospholipase D-like domain-containing protein [Pseudomonadota bacterium]
MINTLGNRRCRYPWREGNRFELLVDGERFFPAMLQSIHDARSHILLEFYLFESGRVANRFIDALLDAARRGVAVYMLLDDYGARGLNQQDRKRLLNGGIQLNFYNPLHYGSLRRNLLRDHRKLLVVDGRSAFTGGAGISDEFDNHDNSLGWHEVMLRICGPVVHDWQALFIHTWSNGPTPLPTLPLPARDDCHGSRPGRLTLNAPSRMEIKRSLIKRLRTAERRIWIATAYFIPSWKIRRLLRRAARRGVDVRLLLPGPHTDHPAVRHAGRRFYATLLRHGVRIYEYQPRFLHAKILLCDEWVSIGSSNIDRWNLRWNLEANQEVLDQAISEQVAHLFGQDFGQSEEYDYASWSRRPWHRRLLEWFWGGIDMWLDRHTRFTQKKDRHND